MSFLTQPFENVNSVIRFFDDPCVSAPWVVYFETALPALGKAALIFLDFGLDDVVRGYARPRGIRGFAHLPRRKRGRARRFDIPELEEMVGRRLPGAKVVRSRVVSNGVKFLWFVDGIIQRGLWYWLVIEFLTDFLYKWTSLIAESEFCKAAHIAGSVARSGKNTVISNTADSNPGYSIEEKHWGSISHFIGGVGSIPTGRGKLIASAQFAQWLPDPRFHLDSVTMWIADLTTGRILSQDQTLEKEKGIVLEAPMLPGHTYRVFARAHGLGPAITTNEQLWAYQEPA